MGRGRYVNVRSRATGELLLRRAAWCASFVCRLRGLMFRRSLGQGEGLVLVERRASRAGVAIHMFFVPFAIAAVWVDDGGRVVDRVRALPWRPYYAPRAPARYTLEAEPDFLGKIRVGEELVFEDNAA